MPWIRTRISIPDTLNPSERKKLARDIILYIQDRSTEGRDKNEEKMAPYTKEYAELKGVSRGDVDLIDSGDMLTSLKLLSDSKGSLTIGFDKDDQELNGKAEGNIKGTYGKTSPIPGKARDFLGIDETVLSALADAADQEEDEITDRDIEKAAKDAARQIFEDIEFDDE